MPRYVLGVNPQELERLQFQQSVWGARTQAFLTRLPVRPGARCLDAGCGPGFVIEDLRAIAGNSGSVIALDESPVWIAHVEAQAKSMGWKNVRTLCSRIEDAPLEDASLDVILLRWVLSFPPDPAAIVRRMSRALAPGGVLAIQDYNHEGVSVFPESEGFRAIVRGTRALYASQGGDPWIAGRLPRLFREAGLRLVELTPEAICGGPDSPAFEWADRFFPTHSENMVRAGVLTEAERGLFLAEWAERKANPDAAFFSPLVVCAAAVKPKST